MVWLSDPVVALEALADADQLHARPMVLSSPVLRVCIGNLSEGTSPQHGTAECKSFHEEVQVACLDACAPHVTALIPVGGQQAVGTKHFAIDLQFSDGYDARLQRQALSDQGSIALQTSHGHMHVPVKSQPGRIPSSCAQLRVHGLPPEFRRQGIIAALLACAGYGDSAFVQAEFGGELPAAIAACHPQIVRGDVAVGVIKPPTGDFALKDLPRSFFDHGNGLRIGVSVESHGDRPARTRASAQHSQPASAGMHVDGSDVDHASSAGTPHASSRQHRRRQKARQRRSDDRRQVPFVRASVPPAAEVPSREHVARRVLGQPLDAVADLGGQIGRQGIGHGAQRGRVRPIAQQAPAPHAMDCPPAGLPADEPLVETCMLWLEERVVDIDHNAMRAVVARFREHNPASWRSHVHCRHLPSRAFRNALRAEVRHQHYGGGIDSDSEEDESSVDASSPQPEASPGVRDAVQDDHGARYCPPHRRRAQASECVPPTRVLPPRSNRGVPAASPYWAGSASQPYALRGTRK